MILIDRGLWEIVNGSEVPPVSDGSEAAKTRLADWKKKDNCAMAQIALTIGNTELVHIKGAKSAHEAWTKICSVYEAKGLATKIFLRRKFFNIKFRENDSMQAHINNVREIADQLDAIGAPVNDSDIAMTLLCSLPEQYDSLTVALESRPSNELTFEFVASRLLAEEKRRQESFNVKVNGTTEAAFLGTSSQNEKRNIKRCSFCKQLRHTEQNCYRKHGFPAGHPLHGKSNLAAITQSTNENSDTKLDSNQNLYGFAGTDGGFGDLKNEWIIDSAASDHYCNNRDMFTDFKSIPAKNITLGDNRVIPAVGCGNILVKIRVDSNPSNDVCVKIADALYVPGMVVNLVSVSKLVKNGLTVSFANNECVVSHNSGKILCRVTPSSGNLYRFSVQPIKPVTNTAYIVDSNSKQEINVKLWHDRLGHLNLESMKLLKNRHLVTDFGISDINNELDLNKLTQCEACIKGKIHRTAMPNSATHRASKILELVHSDVCGPMNTTSLGGAKYFVTFIDDYSRFTVVKLMKAKSEVIEHFIAYRNWAENITNQRIKVLRSDNGDEYVSKEFDQLLSQSGISRQKSPPYTPEHNGVAERANRTIVECARSMLHGADLDHSFWGSGNDCCLSS